MASASTKPVSSTVHRACEPTEGQLVLREQRPGLNTLRIGAPECCQFDFTLTPLPNEDLYGMFLRLQSLLLETHATPVLQFTFGSLESLREGEKALKSVFGKPTWPVTWAEGASALDKGIAGIQVLAVSARPIKRIMHKDQVVACIFDDGLARHCLVGGLGGFNPVVSKPEQTQQSIQQLDSILKANGFAFSEVVRTWFYLDKILSWYDGFNATRSAFYKQHSFRVGSLPASTGVAALNPCGSALAFAAWAVQSKDASHPYPVQEISSPLQGPAASYGSAFSRAVEIQLPIGRRLVVSGTASIDPAGKTVHLDDIQGQIELSMEVVVKILESRGMRFADTVRASVYFKKPEYSEAFFDWCSRHHCQIPAVLIHCDICRDDLLFEIELDAVAERGEFTTETQRHREEGE